MAGTTEDVKSEVGDAEDLPSDFFDDFNKDEFMEGLSVIDECGEDTCAALPVTAVSKLVNRLDEPSKAFDDMNKEDLEDNTNKMSDLDNFIKPGSRRDLTKTNEAIKKDKEVKVLEFLAKSLSASDDLRPPGTELDDYYDDDRKKDKKRSKDIENISFKSQKRNMKEQFEIQSENYSRSRYSPPQLSSPPLQFSNRSSRSPYSRQSPMSRKSFKARRSPQGSSHNPYSFQSPYRTNYMHRGHYNTQKNYLRRSPPRRSPPRRSPSRRNLVRRSPRRHSPSRRSPRKYGLGHSRQDSSHSRQSPGRWSPLRYQSRSPKRSRSPRQHFSSGTHRASSPRSDDNFLYPNSSNMHNYEINSSYQPDYGHQYSSLMPSECPAVAPGYNYPAQVPATGFSNTYEDHSALQANLPVVTPAMVPAPSTTVAVKSTPYDALAQLVAEGKISQQDYLKLTPNKGVVTAMDPNTRFTVLSRCHQAISKLDKLLLPNRLIVNNQNGLDDKYIAPKYCSPLKRQIITEFNFNKGSISQDQQSKQLVDSIIATLGLEKVTSYKKKLMKNMKDALVQTTKPHCEVCQIRESTKYHDVGTSTEPEYFTSTVHTQVVEQDLISSRAIFNPSGSVGEGAAISIAHLTPAQLVSQLAARAKTLKQPQETQSSNQFSRRSNYDYDGMGGQQYRPSYNNYRY